MKNELARKWMEEGEAVATWLDTLSEEDKGEADHLYQEGVSFEDLQTTFKPQA